ncbi:TetR family transcriptional regulator [Nocardia sp. NBC_01730]|uniref:TetR/AcrR family transcriptional regulator n=1 Tax=Nocardia sp. NBC_01730 TaxID=2975998 RepID=UPI002E1502FD|nr:TetR family transcriptional regulator [Nocardia sp. NBC_01730]
MPTKRELLLDAAIDLLGSHGTRALTHRAVDKAAAMPSGSASNYFRTREALLIGIAERLEERDHADWAMLNRIPTPRTLAELVDAMAGFVVHAVATDRTGTPARYALLLEAQTVPALQDIVRRGHPRLTEWAATLLASVGAERAVAKILADYLDGAILHQVVSPAPDFDPYGALNRLVRALVGGALS